MNKISKRITSILIAIALMISLSIPAFASDANDPIGRCRAVSAPQAAISSYTLESEINDPIGRSCIAPIIEIHSK